MEYVSIVLSVAGLAAILYVILRLRAGGDSSSSTLVLQQQLEGMRTEMRDSIQHTAQMFNQRMDSTAQAVQQRLDATTQTMAQQLDTTTQNVNSQLQIVNAQLTGVASSLQNNTGQVGNRLDAAARVIQDVQNKLGELGKATQEIKELGQSVSRLDEMLRAPKYRGGLGEALLEDLLGQVLPAGSFEMQYKFRSGLTVDAIIRTAGHIVPVDSKFPLENFRRLTEAQNDQDRSAAARAFRSDVRKHIDAIATKYILPDEGTFDFALMYIPAENIYYEIIIKDEGGVDEGVHGYATERRVVPVSPNSLYAYLRVIALGLRGMQIEQSARQIFETSPGSVQNFTNSRMCSTRSGLSSTTPRTTTIRPTRCWGNSPSASGWFSRCREKEDKQPSPRRNRELILQNEYSYLYHLSF